MADLTERYTATITLQGRDIVIDHSRTIASLTASVDQTLIVPTTEAVIFTRGATVAGAQLTDFEYLFLKNLDSAITITLAIRQTGSADVAYFPLEAGAFHIFTNVQFEAYGDGTAQTTLVNIETIRAKAASGTPALRIVALD